jgi:hypothetical protein
MIQFRLLREDHFEGNPLQLERLWEWVTELNIARGNILTIIHPILN